jgi:beta-mannanase
MKFGIYRLHEPLDESELASIEDAYGTAIDIVSVFRAWNRCSIKDDLPWLDRLKSSTRDVFLTWEPWMLPEREERACDQPDFALKNIIAGRYDDYIRSFAGELSSFPRTVFLRVMHEMNGNWYPWCGTVNGNSPGDFIAAWDHIRNLVNREASFRIQWVWSPYARSYPPTPVNRMEDYFPGDDVVDWVAMDGYNWGGEREWSEWQSFEEIFSDAYNTLTALSRCPIMIGEMASTGAGGNKGLWINEALHVIETKFPRIQALIWFDVYKECDWRIASSLESLEAFRTGIKLFKRQA